MKITFTSSRGTKRETLLTIGGVSGVSGESGVSLLAANALTLVLAVVQKWDLASLMGVYWAQSVTIGVFQVFKILGLRNFTTDGFTQGGRTVPATRASLRSAAGFFAIHFGFFHFVYLGFLLGPFHLASHIDRYFGFAAAAFFANHLFSYLRHREEDRRRRQNLGTVFFFPYARIVPMHLIIIGGAFLANNTIAVVAFVLLKTVADLVMHGIEHRPASPADNRAPIPS
jgi:hypothetical protein